MSAEGILSNPYLFEKRHEVNWTAAREYLDFAERYESTLSAVRAHLFRICHHRFGCFVVCYDAITYRFNY